MKTLLSTKMLSASSLEKLTAHGFEVTQYNAIGFEFPELPEISPNCTLILSSTRAIEALSLSAIAGVNSPCFCVGEATVKAAQKFGLDVIASAPTSKALAELIVEHHPDRSYCFLCSNRRLDTLPKILTEHTIDFTEITAYHTLLKPKVFLQGFEVILFFSPSGVESFLQKNELKGAEVYCMGATTASYLPESCKKKAWAEPPSMKTLIELVINANK